MKWSFTQKDARGIPIFDIAYIVNTRWFGLELHRFTGTDPAACFHTHPALAIRIGLSGGYVEEARRDGLRAFRAGDIGIIRPSTTHRIESLLRPGHAYTLWIRGPLVAEVELVGCGWRGARE